MPNWVNTTMTVTGDKQSLDEFKNKASKSYTTRHTGTWIDNKYDPDAISIVEHESELSFWNFIGPTDIDAYFGQEKKPDNYETMTFDERMAEAMQFKGDNWYNWNIRNWGTKWDANDVALDDSDGSLSYYFATAWSPAEGAFRAMVEQHPNLQFEFTNVEEQGWGVVFEGKNGELEEVRSWDIPSSHAEWEENGTECPRCPWEDESDCYEDCPRETASTNVDGDTVQSLQTALED